MMSPTKLEDLEAIELQAEETSIFLRSFGSGPAVLLLHGFPQTHLMWRAVAPLLARRFTVICADLRGYGRSGCPASRPDHAPYAKRAIANDMVSIMGKLGFPRFSIAGHDRGGRVAYRLALDHPDQVERLAVLDILPTADRHLGEGRQEAGYRFLAVVAPCAARATSREARVSRS
jgi:haloacetate dehalogenase